MEYQHGGDIYTNQVTMDYSANINPLGLRKVLKMHCYRRLKTVPAIRTAAAAN